MEFPASPSREVLQRSEVYFKKNISESILQQERRHAESKRPRRTRFVLEADSKIREISTIVLTVRKRVMEFHSYSKKLEGKVNRLDVIKEQAFSFMSPQRVLSGSAAAAQKSPVKLTYYYQPNNLSCSSDDGFFSGGDSPAKSNIYGTPSPVPTKEVEFLRRRKLVAVNVSKLLERLNNEKEFLQKIFATNITILRYKRSEKCLIKMIALQSKLKGISKELEALEERLFA